MSLRKVGKQKPKLAALWTPTEIILAEEEALQALAGVGDDSRHHRSTLLCTLHLRRPTTESEREILGLKDVRDWKEGECPKP